jgi:hypothetical protein
MQKPRSSWVRAEASRWLEGGGCPACRAAAATEDRYDSAFVTEQYWDVHTLLALGASLGFCPAHTRRLVARSEAPFVMRTVYEHVTGVALERLERRRAAVPLAACPACLSREGAAERAIWVVTTVLEDSAFSDAFAAAGGFCFPHAAGALAYANEATAAVVIETLHNALSVADGSEALARLVGCDRDAPVRRRLRERLRTTASEAARGDHRTSRSALAARLQLDACPVCVTGALTEERYLAWLGETARDAAGRSTLEVEGLWLCPRHLADIAAEAPGAAEWIGGLLGTAIREAAADCAVRVSTLPPASVAARLLTQRPRRLLRQAITPLVYSRWCRACHGVSGAERRELDLLHAAMHDRVLAATYDDSHGLCARHAEALDSVAAAGNLGRVAAARLRVLAWELAEAGHRSSWSRRFALPGAEATAWLRTAGHLDGWVFLGGPAEAWPMRAPVLSSADSSGARRAPQG